MATEYGAEAIVARNASKMFLDGAPVAFRALNLAVREKEILCIVGPSGCGKTTFLRCIAGLTEITGGELTVSGTPVTEPPQGVAMVFQHFGLLPWKSVYDNAAFGLAMAHAPTARVKERVGLVRALGIAPDILLMDEPFAALDAQTREVLQEELLRIMQDERKTMVFITHSIDEAILLGDRIAVMSSRPARIKEIVDAPLARPRAGNALRADPRFAELRAHIWNELRAPQREAA